MLIFKKKHLAILDEIRRKSNDQIRTLRAEINVLRADNHELSHTLKNASTLQSTYQSKYVRLVNSLLEDLGE